MMTAIIFGASGQDGFYLTQLLQQQDCNIVAISRSKGYLNLDISDYSAVSSLIKQYTPDYIFHFAANSTTQHEFFFENNATIVTGTLHILEAVKNFSPHSKVFISGSALQFKNDDNPIKETTAFEAKDAYSVCRIQSVYTARYYRYLGLKVYVGYFFNHDSPLRTERHMSKKIAEEAKRIANGSNEKLIIGDIKAVKEWTFAGDIVKGVWALVNQQDIFEANIGSGIGYSIEDWLQQCFSLINKDWHNYVTEDKNFIPQYKKLISDPSLIFSLGWRPEVSFEQLATMMIKGS